MYENFALLCILMNDYYIFEGPVQTHLVQFKIELGQIIKNLGQFIFLLISDTAVMTLNVRYLCA